MKYLVHCTAPAQPTFKHSCYRGEPRWEANSVDALLTMGRTVHSTTSIWGPSLPRPENLYDMNMDWMEESIQITYGVPHEIWTGNYPPSANPKYRVVQYQDGPADHQKDKFLMFDRANPGSIVATCSFKSGPYLQRLQNTLGPQNVEWHYGPTVPQVYENHNAFNQNTLLWSYRNFCKYLYEDPNGMKRLFKAVSGWMDSNPELRLVILAQPLNEETQRALQGDCKAWFFSLSVSGALKKHFERVEVLTNQHWCDVLDIYSRTKLVISPAEPLGGPPFEAASYGIPTILERGTNPFIDGNGNQMFHGLLTAQEGFSDVFFKQLDKLHGDQSFYNNAGNSYRSFVKQTATYESWVNKLDEIAKKRGWE